MTSYGPLVTIERERCFADIVDFEDLCLGSPEIPLTPSLIEIAHELMRLGLRHRMPDMVMDRLRAALYRVECDLPSGAVSRTPRTLRHE